MKNPNTKPAVMKPSTADGKTKLATTTKINSLSSPCAPHADLTSYCGYAALTGNYGPAAARGNYGPAAPTGCLISAPTSNPGTPCTPLIPAPTHKSSFGTWHFTFSFKTEGTVKAEGTVEAGGKFSPKEVIAWLCTPVRAAWTWASPFFHSIGKGLKWALPHAVTALVSVFLYGHFPPSAAEVLLPRGIRLPQFAQPAPKPPHVPSVVVPTGGKLNADTQNAD